MEIQDEIEDEFSWQVKKNNLFVDLHFRKVMITSQSKYFVVAQNNNKERAAFDMVFKGGEWKITPPIPGWLQDVEHQITELLKSP